VRRDEALGRLRSREPFDLLVIGGGATGLGIAVDARSRGYTVALLERSDFAQATSSRSTKLIHGGVRYLAQGRIGLVREALHERRLLLKNAPHLVHWAQFLVPAYGATEKLKYRTGLWMYDRLAAARGEERAFGVDAAGAKALAPTLRGAGLRGGVVYGDGQFDDARLALALARTAADRGGVVLNYVEVRGLLRKEGRVAGAVARDVETDEEFQVAARAVINATGVFADEVRALDEPGARPLVRPSRGSHLVFDLAVQPGPAGVLVPKTDDGRVLFAIPWEGRLVLGTTDADVEAVDREPRPDAAEVAYLLDHAARYLEHAPDRTAVRSMFAGLRPLLDAGAGSTAGLSREHAVLVSASGLVTITGGKWTTYRTMAIDAVDRARQVAGLPERPSATEALALHGAAAVEPGAPLGRYGSDAPAVAAVLGERPGLDDLLHPELPYRAGEAVWAARHEAARTVEDVLSRRTRALLLDARASLDAAPRVARLLAEELGRDAAWQADQVRQFAALAQGYLPP
jgi:glycerol-3-phosphate dehydrogenase